MAKLFYFGFCTARDETDNYLGNVAGNLKMKYIASAAKEAGYDVKIVALNKTAQNKYQPSTVAKEDNIEIYHIASIGYKNSIATILNRIFFYAQIIFKVLFQIHANDTVLVYHSMRSTGIIGLLLKMKHMIGILEVEEVYSCAADGKKNYYDKEIRQILRFKQYIFANSFIPEAYNIKENNYILIYGSYINCSVTKRYNNGKIHVVYAGAIETLNKGAFTAIEVSRYLPDNFIVHIIGKGNKVDIAAATKRIEELNSVSKIQKVVYDGFYSGKELDSYMGRCDIGLGTYAIKDDYSNFIFPSKLLSYMSHNLKVVTGRSECYENIEISKDWFFYDSNDYASIAEAIMAASMQKNTQESSILISRLNMETIDSFRIMKDRGTWREQN